MGNVWHVKNWFRVGHNISWKLNFNTLLGFLYLYHKSEFFYKQSIKKHDFILSYLKNDLSNVIEKYKQIPEREIETPTSNKIWILWWQGEETAPPLVKTCINSTREHANGAEVIVITKNNIASYIDIPQYIFEKKDKGWISFAQLSDIIRFFLLEKYGGLWLDATIYTAQDIPKDYFSYNFFSQHTKWEKTCFVQHNLYHGFIIASKPKAKLVSFAREMFIEYWKKHDTLIDYLMIDYIIMIAYQEFPDIKQEIDHLPWSSERLYELVHLLSEPYDKEEFTNLKIDCIFSKLDWHKEYKTKKNGKSSYYDILTKDFR